MGYKILKDEQKISVDAIVFMRAQYFWADINRKLIINDIPFEHICLAAITRLFYCEDHHIKGSAMPD